MKRSNLFLLVPTLLAALTLAMFPAAQQSAFADDDEEEGPIHEAMEIINDNFRVVRRQADDATLNADSADRLGVIMAAVSEAKLHMPETATTDELRASYRLMMNRLLVEIALAENAALEGDNAALAEHIGNANNIRREGHAAFIPEE